MKALFHHLLLAAAFPLSFELLFGGPTEALVWKSEVPEGCPFPPSKEITGIRFTGRHGDYHCGDTIYPSWAADGNLYTPWTDGTTDGVKCQSGYDGNIAMTGHAVIVGDNPLELKIRNTSPPNAGSAWPYLGRYLMCVTDGWPSVSKMDSYLLEADVITGPWRMVCYLKGFGQQAYFLNFPSKFLSEDGRKLWLCYSANFSDDWNGEKLVIDPPGGRYGLSLLEVELLGEKSAD